MAFSPANLLKNGYVLSETLWGVSDNLRLWQPKDSPLIPGKNKVFSENSEKNGIYEMFANFLFFITYSYHSAYKMNIFIKSTDNKPLSCSVVVLYCNL